MLNYKIIIRSHKIFPTDQITYHVVWFSEKLGRTEQKQCSAMALPSQLRKLGQLTID